jgi:hypothetical protein
MAFDKLVVGSWNIKLSWRSVWCNIRGEALVVGNVFVLVCYLNGKWLKNLHVFYVSLLY